MRLSPPSQLSHHGRPLRFGGLGFGESLHAKKMRMTAEFLERFPGSPSPSYLPALTQLVQNTRYCLEADYHRYGLTTLEHARDMDLLKDRRNITLINVDSHSDLRSYDTEPSSGYYDADWINGALVNHPEISEVLWVIPRELKQIYDQIVCTKPIDKLRGAMGAFFERATLYVDRLTPRIAWEVPPAYWIDTPGELDRISFRILTEDQLPNMKDRDVYLSLDMDYFSNNGHDTFKEAVIPYKGEDGIRGLFEKLNAAQIAPFLLNTALSPHYSVQQKWRDQTFTLAPLAVQLRKLTNTLWERSNQIPPEYPLDELPETETPS